MSRSPDILIAEDDPVIRRAVKAALKSEGYSVRETPDGAAALKAFGEIMKNCKTLCASTRKGTVTTLAAKSADGKTGWLLVSDYCGKGKEIVLDVKGVQLLTSALVFDHERNFVPAHMTIMDGRLTLKKEMDGSVAFLVTFDLP